ncbi:DUF1918 domain-containing protein [Streptomyces sp. NPDC048718]|uniref:DUF1918 domain-containing protein n=1 Tax=Streptomyces sp. NPDC048718 TaxID=3365587 RepID=UPI003724C39B
MQASIGDRIIIKGGLPGQERAGEIIEVKGFDGAPPYLVRFADGHEGLVSPGPDAVILPAGA